MPKGQTTANDVINAVLRAVDPAWRSGATRYVSLHTATPGAGGVYSNDEYAVQMQERKLRIAKDEKEWMVLIKIYVEQCL